VTFAQRRNRFTTHFSECVPVVKRRMTISRGVWNISRYLNTYVNEFIPRFVAEPVPMLSVTSGGPTLTKRDGRAKALKAMKCRL
jgi:hypothetical protein